LSGGGLSGGGLSAGGLGVGVGRTCPWADKREAENQREKVEAQARRAGIHLVCSTFVDENVSFDAPLERRTETEHAIRMIEAGEANWLVLVDFDRLGGPSPGAMEEWLMRVWAPRGHGKRRAHVLTIRGEEMNSSVRGHGMRKIARQRLWCEEYLRLLAGRERLERAKVEKIRRRQPNGGELTSPFGMRREVRNGKAVNVPVPAQLDIEDRIRALSASGVKNAEIKRTMEADPDPMVAGGPTQKGWSLPTIANIIARERPTVVHELKPGKAAFYQEAREVAS